MSLALRCAIAVALASAVPTSAMAAFSGVTLSLVPVTSSADEATHLFKTSAGDLYSLNVTNKGGAAFLMLFDANAVPADGTLSTAPAACVGIAAGSNSSPTSVSLIAAPGIAIHTNNGIAAALSTTGCLVKTTASPVGFFQAVFQ